MSEAFKEVTISERRSRLNNTIAAGRYKAPWWWASQHYSDHNPKLVDALWGCYDELKKQEPDNPAALLVESEAHWTP